MSHSDRVVHLTSPRTWLRSRALVAVVLTLAATRVYASPSPGPAILVHLRAVTSKNACSAAGLSDCQAAVTRGEVASSGAGPFYFAYLVGTTAPANTPIGALVCGISYQDNQIGNRNDSHGVEIYSWNLCATLEFPAPGAAVWPETGGGNLIVWDANTNCQTGGLAVAGYFYMGAYDRDLLGVIPHPVFGQAKLGNCLGIEQVIARDHLGYAAFSPGATDAGCGCNGGCPGLPAPPPAAGPTALSLHLLRPPALPSICSAIGTPDCATSPTAGRCSAAGEHYYAYVLASIGGMRGLGGATFGISYQAGLPGAQLDGAGVDILAWGDCRSSQPYPPLTTPGWPAPGSGIQIYWAAEAQCQNPGPTVPVGYLYLSAYSPDELRLTTFPLQGTATLADCYYRETALPLAKLGRARFSPSGLLPGCRPCVDNCDDPTPVVPTTWSGIKTVFSEASR